MAVGQKIVSELDPVLDRPIFCLAAAAGVKNDVCAKMTNGPSIFVAWKKMRGRIRERQTQSVKRPRQLERGVFAVVQLRRSRQESNGSAFANVLFENFVRIVEVTDDEIEAREIFAERGAQLGIAR